MIISNPKCYYPVFWQEKLTQNMEIKTKKESLFSQKELDDIRNTLPYHYYADFKKIWKRTHGRDKVPSRQTVYKTLKGDIDNHKVIKTLVDMTQERVNLKQEVKEVLSHAEG